MFRRRGNSYYSWPPIQAGSNPNRVVRSRLRSSLAIVAGCTVLLHGCGSGASESTGATQVVARVNDHELTVSELRQALAQQQAGDASPEVIKIALKRLIDEELLVQAAKRAKVDREPAVVMRVDAVQREILARAYEERYLFPGGAIDETELHKFYDANPELFSARRIYRTVTFITDQRQLPDAFLAQVTKENTADAVRASLDRQKIGFHTEDARIGAESMPLPLLPRLGSAKVGDVLVWTGPDGQTQLMLLTGIDDSPVSYEEAAGSIAHFLRGQRDQAALRAYLQQLKASSKIEYVDSSVAQPSTQK